MQPVFSTIVLDSKYLKGEHVICAWNNQNLYNQNLTHRYLGPIDEFVMNSLVEYVFFEVDQSKASKVFPW